MDQGDNRSDDTDSWRVTAHVVVELVSHFVFGAFCGDFVFEDVSQVFWVCSVNSGSQTITQEVVLNVFAASSSARRPSRLACSASDTMVSTEAAAFEGLRVKAAGSCFSA